MAEVEIEDCMDGWMDGWTNGWMVGWGELGLCVLKIASYRYYAARKGSNRRKRELVVENVNVQ